MYDVTETFRVRPWPTRLAVASAVFIIALGLTVLAGWFSHVALLIQFLPDLPAMTRNAAACFMLCGLALLTEALRGQRRFVVVCAGIVSAVSVLTIVHIPHQCRNRRTPGAVLYHSQAFEPGAHGARGGGLFHLGFDWAVAGAQDPVEAVRAVDRPERVYHRGGWDSKQHRICAGVERRIRLGYRHT